ncbi:MAG TPA: tetratricopeptide repeat protein [Cyclobacteriaceae bacterium]|nr:tetratricopeptide repeat protein [Cyclobacteriaceae bacterium]
MLPKVVVDNKAQEVTDSISTEISASKMHDRAGPGLKREIAKLRAKYQAITEKEKNAIFADSLADLYRSAGMFDSAAWFAGDAATFFNTTESWIKAGDQYYQAFAFALDEKKQQMLAEKAQEFYEKVMTKAPGNLTVKTKLAMTYLSSNSPMKGIVMLREVLAQDPKNKEALFNMGMLSIQSGQYDKAVERFEELLKVDSTHLQGQLLLGVALLNQGEKERAKIQFEKVKRMDNDPAVQAEVDSYLKDLK